MKKTNNLLQYIGGYLIAFFVVMLVVFMGEFLNDLYPLKLTQVAETLLIILIAIFIFNIIIYVKLRKKYKLDNGQSVNEFIISKQEEAKKDYKKVENKILYSYRLLIIYTYFIYVMFALTIAFFSNSETLSYAIVLSIIYIYALGSYFSNILIFNKETKIDKNLIFLKEDASELYALVEEIFIQEEINKKFIILKSNDNQVSIGQYRRRILITIGFNCLQMLNVNELKAILIHECAHYKKDDVKNAKRHYRYICRMEIMANINVLAQVFFYPFNVYLLIDSQVYTLLTTIYHERIADDEVLKKNKAQDMVNGVAKLFAFEIYNWSLKDKSYIPLNEKIPNDLISREYSNFIEFYNKNKEYIVNCFYNVLPARVATHPTLKERMEALNIKEVQISFEHPDNLIFKDLILKEEEKYVRWLNLNTIDNFNYEHQKCLEFLKSYREFLTLENQTIQEKVDMLANCLDNSYFKEALALAYEIIKENSKQTRAKFTIGLLETKMNLSNVGIEYLKEILLNDSNSQFYADSYEILGTYFLYNGLHEEIKWLRNLSIQVVDNNKLYEELSSLNFKCKLYVAQQDEIFKGLIELISKYEEIKCVVCLEKKKENMQVTHVLVEFKEKIEGKEIDKIMNSIWAYLDSAETSKSYILNVFNLRYYKDLLPYIVYRNN